MHKKVIALFIPFIAFFLGCNSEKISPSDTDESLKYLNLVLGDTSTFEISETVFDNFGESNTVYYEKRIVTSIEDDYYLIDISRSEDGLNFEKTETISYDLSNNQVILNRSNQRLLELTLPVKKGAAFDQHLYNANDQDLITVEQYQELVSNDNIDYPNALKTSKNTINNAIDQKEYFAIYQPYQGLVYRYDKLIGQQPNQNKIGRILIEKQINK